MVGISGATSSACLGAVVNVSTVELLEIHTGEPCPRAGQVVLFGGGELDLASYDSNPNVAIDLGNDGSFDETFQTCLDPQLLVCPAG
jgi:hypothetical protein